MSAEQKSVYVDQLGHVIEDIDDWKRRNPAGDIRLLTCYRDGFPANKQESGTIPTPFDPRTEISADAKHIASKIVTHLWIIFVLLPVGLALLYLIVIKTLSP